MIRLLVDRIDEEAREYTVFGKLAEHMLPQEICLRDDADHDIIFSEWCNRVWTIGINQENLVFLQSDGSSINNLRTAAGINIIDFNVGMDMFRNSTESGILFD